MMMMMMMMMIDIYVTSAEKTEPAKRLPYHWVLGTVSSGIKQPLLAIHFYLILTLRMRGFLPPLPLKDV
jgi:hypothetical protein